MPVNINAKIEIPVINNENKVKYFLKRFNKNVIVSLLSYREPKSSVNIALTDNQNNQLVEIREAWSLSRKFIITDSKQVERPEAKANSTSFEFVLNQCAYQFVRNSDCITLYVNDKSAMKLISDLNGFSLKHTVYVNQADLNIPLALACIHKFLIAY